MKNFKFLFVLLLGFTIASCTSDDTTIIKNQTEIKGGIQIGSDFIETPYVYINDENITNDNPCDLAIIMSNTFLLVENIDAGIDYMYVDYLGVNFASGPKELLNYRITKNASRVNNLIQGGNRLLEDNLGSNLNATEISFVINSISSEVIDFQFSFTRLDGVLITGYYSGDYTVLSQ